MLFVQVPRLLKLLFFLSLLTGCTRFRPTAYFFISNISRDNKPVDIEVSIAGKTVFNDTIRYTGIQPDLSNTQYMSLPKGKYTIKVAADGGKATTEQAIDFANDRWIFISYSFAKPIDSTEGKLLLNNVGMDTAWINHKLKGSQSKVTVYVMDREPVHM